MSSEEDKMKAFKEQLLSVWDDEKVQEKLKQMLAVKFVTGYKESSSGSFQMADTRIFFDLCGTREKLTSVVGSG